LLAAVSGALGAATFVKLAEKDNSGSDQTGENRMLEVSRDEVKKRVDDDDRGFSRLRHEAFLVLDLYIWEPVCTAVRFLHLVAIFVPVILTVPALWIGSKQTDRDSKRSGTLWWYAFLVKSMERAGPAFIKVWKNYLPLGSASG
jgi:aarF domain-containing kinase